MTMLALSGPCSGGGWCPGTARSGAADPSSTPDPATTINGVIPALRQVLFSSAGAALLALVAVYALMKGWQWYTAMFRKPRQMTLF